MNVSGGGRFKLQWRNGAWNSPAGKCPSPQRVMGDPVGQDAPLVTGPLMSTVTVLSSREETAILPR